MVLPDREASVHEATTTGPSVPSMSGPAPATTPSASRIALPGYRDFAQIARSNVSEVYRAVQEGVDRPVAVKVLLLDDEDAVVRFQRELAITVELGRQHPHIVTVIDTGVSNAGRPCIVMEFYDQGSLYDRLRERGPLPWSEVVAAGVAVADALAFAHRHGVLHRDVKPQNILVLPTSYVVADFGVARRINAAHTSSVDWFSFRHAAPQVLDGEPPAVADDIWSLGSTLHTLLEGRSPFAADNAGEDTALAYMKRVRTSRPTPLPRTDVPPDLVAVIDRCLRYDPRDRYADADSLLHALKDVAAQRQGWAPRQTTPPPTGGSGRPVGQPHPGAVVAGAQAPPPVMAAEPAARVDSRETSLRQAPADRTSPRQPRPGEAPPREPPSDTPLPAAPAPSALAPSALAHLLPRGDRPPASELPTGMGPYVAELTSATGHAPPAAPSSLRRVALLATIGVVIGGLLALGVVLTGVFQRSPSGGGVNLPSIGPAASQPVQLPTTGGETLTNNPGLAPTITRLEVDGARAFLQWRDPSGGRSEFVVVRVAGSTGTGIGQTRPGTTELLVERLDPAQPPYCFLVMAVLGEQRGVSEVRCAEVVPTR